MPLPSVRRPAVLIVSACLREARERRKVGLRQLADQLSVSPARLSGLELATHIPRQPDVAHILGFLGIGGKEHKQLIAMAEHVYDDNLVTQNTTQTFSLMWTYEQISRRVVDWAPYRLPELLRLQRTFEGTPDAKGEWQCHGELEPLERSVRQQAMHDGTRRYVFLIGEEAVRTARDAVGSGEQIQHLRAAASLHHVSVRIVPMAAMGLNPPPAFTLFEDRPAAVAVALKHLHCTAYLTERPLLDEYLDTAKALQRQALSESATVDALNDSAWDRAS
jgi:transcriptional regulator with XRE-family HTH domain